MTAELKKEFLTDAIYKFQTYLKTGLAGSFHQGWDRMRASTPFGEVIDSVSIDQQKRVCKSNARALIHLANRQLTTIGV